MDQDREKLQIALKASIEAMSPEDRRKFAMSLCDGVNKLSRAIVENKDAIWASAAQTGVPKC